MRHGRTSLHACPTRPATTVPAGRSPWLDVDWREHQRWVTIDGRRVNVVELGSGPPVVFIHGLSGSWQNWLEQLPVFAREHRVIAFDLPGFGESEMPAREDHDLRLRALRRRAARRARRRAAPRWWATRWAASSASSSPSASPSASSGWCSSSAAGLSIEYLRNERALAAARRARRPPGGLQRLAGLALGHARAPPGRAADDLRHRRPPSRAPPRPARRRAGPRLGQARLRARPRRAHRLPDPRPPGRDRLPDADRLGRRGQARPRARRRRVRAPDPQLPQGRLAGDRPRGDARAPGGLQRARSRRSWPRSRASASARRTRPARR